MNIHELPLRVQAGQIVHLRLEQLPAAQRVKTTCLCGSQDSGWRIIPESCARRHDAPFAALHAAWTRLARARQTPETLADLRLMAQALPVDHAQPAGPLPQRWSGLDLRLWITHAESRRRLLGESPPPAVLSPLAAHAWWPWWKKREQDWDACLEAPLLALHHGHEEDREALLAIMLREGDIAWLPLLARQPIEFRLALLRALVLAKQHLVAPPARMHRLLEALQRIVERSKYASTAQTCLQSLANGCTPRFVAFALRYHLRWKLDFQTQARPQHEPRAQTLHLLLHRPIPSYLRRPADVWKNATGLENWSQAVSALFSRPRPKIIVEAILDGIRELGRKRKKDAPDWKHWLRRWDDMLRELDALPRLVRPFAEHLLYAWRVVPSRTQLDADSVEQLLQWLRRARSFSKAPGEDVARVIEALMACLRTAEDRAALLAMPETVWQRIQPAVIGWSARQNITHALQHVTTLPPGCVPGMIAAAPLDWARVMIRAGALTCREAVEIWQNFREHPLVACDVTCMPLKDALVLVDAIRDSHPRFPGVPEKLRGDLSAMPQHVQAHYRDELARNACRLRLAVLEELAEHALRRRFPHLRTEKIKPHTLWLAAGMGTDNRRPMRRLLQTCAKRQATRTRWLAHPQNEKWLRSQPASRAQLWADGFTIERSLPDLGTLSIGPEDDLESLLRMGTDFGTCLSAGSFNSFSTVANALDANKRVIFARDERGRAWARQLLAITESGHLVCFPVYVRRRRKDFEQLFAAYDHTLAHLLRLPIWRSYRAELSIAPLVCKEWYDDGFWQP